MQLHCRCDSIALLRGIGRIINMIQTISCFCVVPVRLEEQKVRQALGHIEAYLAEK